LVDLDDDHHRGPWREAEHLDELRALASARGLEPTVLDPVFELIYGNFVCSHQDVAASHQIDAAFAADTPARRVRIGAAFPCLISTAKVGLRGLGKAGSAMPADNAGERA
jgi:hypothetical protein